MGAAVINRSSRNAFRKLSTILLLSGITSQSELSLSSRAG